MLGRLPIITIVTFSLFAGFGPAPASGKAKEAGAAVGSNEIEAKLAASYVAVPKLHMAVQSEGISRYRSLELEVWLLQSDPEKHQILNSKKKLIAAQMKEDFAAYDWAAFEDSAGGPVVAKQVVAASVERASGVKVEDVMIKTLILK
jgi:hypothetical protein